MVCLAVGCSLGDLTNGQPPGSGGAGQGGSAGSTSTAMGGAGGIGQGGGGQGGGSWAGGRCANGPPGSAVEWACSFGNAQDQGTGVSAVRVAAGTERLFFAASTDDAMDLGGGPLGVDGVGNIILAGLSPQGFVEWNQAAAGSATQKILGDVAVSPMGRVAVVARYQYGDMQLGAATMTARGQDSYLALYDGNGGLVGARFIRDTSPAGTREQRALSVAFDSAGNVLVGGEFRDTLEVADEAGVADPDCVRTGTTVNRDAFVLKLDSALNCQWTLALGAGNDDGITAVAAGPSGELIAGGYFRGTVAVGATQLTSTTSYADDGVVFALDPAGAPIWAKSFGSSNSDRVQDLAVGDDGLFVAGYHGGGLTMMECSPAVPSSGGRDALIARLGLDGVCGWTSAIRSSQDDEALAITTLGGAPVFGGYFRAQLQSDPSATLVGATDAMLAPLDGATGAALALLRLGSLGIDVVQALAPSADGEAVFVAGGYGGPISELPIPSPVQPQDFFLARVRVAP